MRGAIKASVPSVGKPIDSGGSLVATGDLVVADDGTVVIPAIHAEVPIAKGQGKSEKETYIMDKLHQGRTTLDLLGAVEVEASPVAGLCASELDLRETS